MSSPEELEVCLDGEVADPVGPAVPVAAAFAAAGSSVAL